LEIWREAIRGEQDCPVSDENLKEESEPQAVERELETVTLAKVKRRNLIEVNRKNMNPEKSNCNMGLQGLQTAENRAKIFPYEKHFLRSFKVP
jgi:hypothetical protein